MELRTTLPQREALLLTKTEGILHEKSILRSCSYSGFRDSLGR